MAKKLNTRMHCIFFFLLMTLPAYPQMSLISSTPAQGDINVSTSASISFTFSLPVDTTARFHLNFDTYFLNLNIYPRHRIKGPVSYTLSPDMKTVTLINLQMDDGVSFVAILEGVRSTTGEMLDHPAVFTFSTGPSLPASSVSGRITNAGGAVLNTVVELLLFFNDGPAVQAATLITSADGSFTIPYVIPGTYSLIALKEINNDGELDAVQGDLLGVYDTDFDGFADEFSVNGNHTGFDFSIDAVHQCTAQVPLERIIPHLNPTANGLALVYIEGRPLDASGVAPEWGYGYLHTASGMMFTYIAIGSWIYPGAVNQYDPPPTPLPDLNWLNSNQAMTLAEDAGGRLFRATYPDAEVSALLGASEILAFGGEMNDPLPQYTDQAGMKKSSTFQPSPGSGSYWAIYYFSESSNQFMIVYIDATNGNILSPKTAGAGIQSVTAQALQKAADAQLADLYSPELNVFGLSQVWIFNFYSASQSKNYSYLVNDDVILFLNESASGPVPTLGTYWIDSDVALDIADNNGGSAFRNANPGTTVFASLTPSPGMFLFGAITDAALKKPAPSRPAVVYQAFWTLSYSSDATGERFSITIDAISSRVLAPVTAGIAADRALLFAQDWAADAAQNTLYALSDSLGVDGTTEIWLHEYYSPSKDSSYIVITYHGAVQHHYALTNQGNTVPLPLLCLDSDQAVAIMEAHGGAAFRSSHARVHSAAFLGMTSFAGAPLSAFWRITYTSSPDTLSLLIDAVTGLLLTDVSRTGSQPSLFTLDQNYPNPFNPETTITYHLPRTLQVAIRILNVTGRTVRILEDQPRGPGSWQVLWDGRDDQGRSVGSGVYFYEMKAGKTRQIRRMMLVK